MMHQSALGGVGVVRRDGVEVRVVAERLARVVMPVAGTNGVAAPAPMPAP